jgi:hypothetical protein
VRNISQVSHRMSKFAAWAKLPMKDLFEKTSEENYGR